MGPEGHCKLVLDFRGDFNLYSVMADAGGGGQPERVELRRAPGMRKQATATVANISSYYSAKSKMHRTIPHSTPTGNLWTYVNEPDVSALVFKGTEVAGSWVAKREEKEKEEKRERERERERERREKKEEETRSKSRKRKRRENLKGIGPSQTGRPTAQWPVASRHLCH